MAKNAAALLLLPAGLALAAGLAVALRPKTAQAPPATRPSVPSPPAPVTSGPPSSDALGDIAKGLPALWSAGLVDNITFAELDLGGDTLRIAARPLSVKGVFVPVSWSDMLAVIRTSIERGDADRLLLPVTDRLWDARERIPGVTSLYLAPPSYSGKPEMHSPESAADWTRRIREKAPAGPIAGPWKEWILETEEEHAAKPDNAVNYGFSNGKGGVYQSRGTRHHAAYKGDYSQLWAPVARRTKRGVDLLRVYGAPLESLTEPEMDLRVALTGGRPVYLPEPLRSALSKSTAKA